MHSCDGSPSEDFATRRGGLVGIGHLRSDLSESLCLRWTENAHCWCPGKHIHISVVVVYPDAWDHYACARLKEQCWQLKPRVFCVHELDATYAEESCQHYCVTPPRDDPGVYVSVTLVHQPAPLSALDSRPPRHLPQPHLHRRPRLRRRLPRPRGSQPRA